MEKSQKILKYGTIASGAICICIALYFFVMITFAGSISSIVVEIPLSSEVATFHLETFYWFSIGIACVFFATLVLGGLYSLTLTLERMGEPHA